MVTVLKYKKRTIDSVIYIRLFPDITVSYLTLSTDDVLNTINNVTYFSELRKFYQEAFDIKNQEGYVLK